MVHLHSVYDVDKHFNIDSVTRQIRNESSAKSALIQYDHNSERFTFDLPKEIEGHNMMDCNVVEIHYLNIDSVTGEVTKGIYAVDDMQLSPTDENVVIFSWLISANATQRVGSLNFLVRFACVADDGTVEYAWHTDTYKKISISSGINNTNYVATKYADVLEQWKNEVLNIAKGTNGFSPIVNFTEVAEGYKLSITDEDGTKEILLKHGENGSDGHTPVKGVDYFDGANGSDGKDGKDGKDGVTPTKGVDYWTESDVAEIKAYIDRQLGVVENGTY